MKKKELKKIEKASSISSAAARAEIERAAAALEPFADDGQVAGLISKMRALAEGGKTSSLPLTASVTKVEESLSELAELRKRDDLSPEAWERVRKVSRDLQLAYLRKESPAAAAALEASIAQSQGSNEAQWVGRQVPVVGDDAEIRKAAEKLRKADSGLSEYEALERAYKAARAA